MKHFLAQPGPYNDILKSSAATGTSAVRDQTVGSFDAVSCHDRLVACGRSHN